MLRLKRAWRDGTTAFVFTPHELIGWILLAQNAFGRIVRTAFSNATPKAAMSSSVVVQPRLTRIAVVARTVNHRDARARAARSSAD